MPDSAAVPKLLATTIDCVDLEAMTAFWATFLDVEHEVHEPYGFLAPSEGRRATIWLQRVPESATGKNRIHLDLVAADLDATTERVLALGGSVEGGSSWQQFSWTTYGDPEGNLFDVMKAETPDPPTL